MIRQAISCDICGAEKKQTNHWFVACEQAGELRVSGWNSRNRLRAGSKHLCGQTCLHKLVDEFMARTIAGRIAPAPTETAAADDVRVDVDTSLTSASAYCEMETSARGMSASPAAIPARPMIASGTTAALPLQPRLVEPALPVSAVPSLDDTPVYASRRWRAEAWERERSRELRAVERHPDLARRRKGF
ncbi:MAG TPA: hypothetical protein VG225_06685 [Terracidiphilus sp.]|nr:hypothetical protein [Terracidiphilus sp.]